MRILAFVGLGLPVLAVSGAVAYGSVKQISTILRSSAAVVPAVAAAPTNSALVRVSLSSWAVPEPDLAATNTRPLSPAAPAAALGISGFVLNELPVATMPAAIPAEAQTLANVEGEPAPVVRPKPRAVFPRKSMRVRGGIAPTGGNRTVLDTREKAVSKRAFKMPWQTGIFQ